MIVENTTHHHFIGLALNMALENASAVDGGPFAAIIVRNGEVVGRGCNSVTSTNDPTAHAEVLAIRDACKNLGTFQLAGCDLYTSCEPCPMCLGAIYWARPSRVFYAASKQDASAAGFADGFIYEQIALAEEKRSIPFLHITHKKTQQPFEMWRVNDKKTIY